MFFRKKDEASPTEKQNTQEEKHPCCESKESTHEKNKSPSIFEFLNGSSCNDGKDDGRTSVSMIGHCQEVEGGLNACVWVPTAERQHKVVF
jgi:hypothetical protein